MSTPQALLVFRLPPIKEGCKHREQEIGAENNVVVGSARQDGELRRDEIFTIPTSVFQATTQQAEKFSGLCWRKRISVARDNQRGDFHSSNRFRPIIVLAHGLSHSGDKAREILGLWRDFHISIMHGSANKRLSSN